MSDNWPLFLSFAHQKNHKAPVSFQFTFVNARSQCVNEVVLKRHFNRLIKHHQPWRISPRSGVITATKYHKLYHDLLSSYIEQTKILHTCKAPNNIFQFAGRATQSSELTKNSPRYISFLFKYSCLICKIAFVTIIVTGYKGPTGANLFCLWPKYRNLPELFRVARMCASPLSATYVRLWQNHTHEFKHY